MKHFLAVIDAINDWTGKVVSFLIYIMIGALAYEVFVRYLINKPTNWAHELSGMFFGAYLVLAGSYALRHNAHVNMDILYSRLSLRGQAILDLFGYYILFFVFCGLALWEGWLMATESLRLREVTVSDWRPPIYPLKFFMPVGAFLILLAGIARFIRGLRVIATGRKKI